MSDFGRLRTWLRRAAPRPFDLVKALFMASVASLAGTGLFVGALALLVVSAQRPGLRALAVFLVAIELVAFLRSPLRFGERMSTHRLGFAAVAHWREWLMRTVGNWDYSRWQRFASGDLLERSLGDTEELQDLWLRGVIPSVATLLTMVVGDVVIGLLAPGGQWWTAAVLLVAVQILAVLLLASGLRHQVDADRQRRRARGEYVATLVSSRAAAPEIARLGATEFLRSRDQAAVSRMVRAEDALRRVRRRDVALLVLGPLAGVAVVARAHPRSAPVWVVVAALVAMATYEALATLRSALHVCVSVTGGAERLDDLDLDTTTAHTAWPGAGALAFNDVMLNEARRTVSGVVAPGRRVGVSGASGAGKSTLLRILAGLDAPGGATITVGGVALNALDEEQLRRHVVLVPSEPGLLQGYVRDVVGLGVELGERGLAALVDLGLEVQANDYWEEPSRGERQRAAIVRALIRGADIVLLDEPTSALGESETAQVLALLDSSSASLVIASHDPRVLQWCDEVIDVTDARD